MTTYFQYLQILGTTKSHILTNFTEAQAVFFISIYYISYGFFLLPYVLHRMEPYSASDVVVFHICVSVWNLKERGRCTILGFSPCLAIRQRCSLQKICQRLLGSTFFGIILQSRPEIARSFTHPLLVLFPYKRVV